MRTTLMLLALSGSIPNLDSCRPSEEQCSAAQVAVHAKEMECGAAAASPAEKAGCDICHEAKEWRDIWLSKCGAP